MKIISCLDKAILYLSNKNIYTYKLGLARSVLAIGTFLTLIFNNTESLFAQISNDLEYHNSIQYFNYFRLFSDHLNVAKWFAIFILGLVISGWRPRFTCILHFWICISFCYATPSVEGGDQIASNLTLLLIPIFICDDRKWHWSLELGKSRNILLRNLIANIFLILIKLQMSLIYLHAAIGKASKEEWVNGTAIYYWANDPIFGITDFLRPIVNPLVTNTFFVTTITWGAIALELFLFSALTMRKKLQIPMLFLGLIFHILIIVIHGLFSFFFPMAAGLLLYLWVDNPYGKIKRFEKIT